MDGRRGGGGVISAWRKRWGGEGETWGGRGGRDAHGRGEGSAAASGAVRRGSFGAQRETRLASLRLTRERSAADGRPAALPAALQMGHLPTSTITPSTPSVLQMGHPDLRLSAGLGG